MKLALSSPSTAFTNPGRNRNWVWVQLTWKGLAGKLLIVTSRQEIHKKLMTVEKLMCGRRDGRDCLRFRESE